MAIVKQSFEPGCALLPTANAPEPIQIQGSNGVVAGLAFDGTTSETCFFSFKAHNYGSGDITVTFEWYAASGTTNAVVFGASLACITPNTDTQDAETDTYPANSTVADSHLGTTAKRVHNASITVTGASLDGIAADDDVSLRFQRLPADAGDTMTGIDAIVKRVTVSYSDT